MNRKKAFTLIELLVVVAIIALLISILLPSLARARELSKRVVCAANSRGIGQACKIYAQENEEFWPTIETTESTVSYTRQIGRLRTQVTNSSSSQVSTTRNFWMLIRDGNITVKLMKCPSSTESIDDTENLALYYDFKGSGFVSYGYQIPYPIPNLSRPSEDMDPRMCLVSDRGPYTITTSASDPEDFNVPGIPGQGNAGPDIVGNILSKDANQALNSPNHGGFGNGDGQNILFQDGHAEFVQKSFAGVDNDNIFTHLSFSGNDMRLGDFPNGTDLRPGERSLLNNRHSSTDSFIYP